MFFAHSVSCFIVGCLGLLYHGSSTASNSIMTACISLLYMSYSIPVLCMLYKGRNNIRHGPFWLGKLGMAANVLTIVWTIFSLVMYSFPASMPAQTSNMNYVCVVYSIMVIIILADWFACGRGSFKSGDLPQEKIEVVE